MKKGINKESSLFHFILKKNYRKSINIFNLETPLSRRWKLPPGRLTIQDQTKTTIGPL